MKVASKISAFLVIWIVAVSVWMKRQLVPTHRYLPWHQTPQWRRFLDVYDKLALRYFKDCEPKLLSTSFGQTQIYACGSATKPPIMFFHGAGSNLLMYGQWLMPAFKETHYSIAVDNPCDTGRSIPPDSDPSKCPSTEEEIADWVAQVLSKIGVTTPASLVGYSYGAVVSFMTARHRSKLVDKLVLLAPASIFEEISPSFLWRALVFALFLSDWSQNWFLHWLSADPNYDLFHSPPDDLEQLVTIREVAATVLSVPAEAYNDTVLEHVASRHRTFLGIGDMEVVLKNLSVAIERAQRVGVEVQVYPNTGHLMLIEASDSITKDVVEFLNK